MEQHDDAVAEFGNQLHKSFNWRIPRLKTVGIGLVLALNIGIDPPDVLRCPPCAKLEAWVDPTQAAAAVSAENISKALQSQYEPWQSRARVRAVIKPTHDDMRRLCVTLRRHAKSDRLLLHYNGHGVPWPTLNGEIWVFDKMFTKYMPLSIFDLQTFVGGPTMYVFDCAGAGRIVYWYQRFLELREENGNDPLLEQLRDTILLAACGASEQLPTDENLPADLFTACLTTPIKVALRWHCLRSYLLYGKETLALVDALPGSSALRKTPLGELNWIFTAITDAIAFDVLPTEVFLALFRQDVLVASMFRNFLLASRVMRSHKCTPVSVPAIPDCSTHRLWDAWDMVVDDVLQRLPGRDVVVSPSAEYVPSQFFQQQMQELRSWLAIASACASPAMGIGPRKPPEQLPIVLQVMLSQSQRKEALELIAEFVSVLGSWAVEAVLGVDLFPYLSKLLRSNNLELRWYLVVIWQRILCVDLSARKELVAEKGYRCFLSIVESRGPDVQELIMALFVLAVTCCGFREAQQSCLKHKLVQLAVATFDHESALVRKWAILALTTLWSDFVEAKLQGIQHKAHEKLCLLLSDAVPEVRAAAAYCVGKLVCGPSAPDLVTVELNLALTLRELSVSRDCAEASSLVRKQIAVALVGFARARREHFGALRVKPAAPLADEERQYRRVCKAVWKHLLFLESDPDAEISAIVKGFVEVEMRSVGAGGGANGGGGGASVYGGGSSEAEQQHGQGHVDDNRQQSQSQSHTPHSQHELPHMEYYQQPPMSASAELDMSQSTHSQQVLSHIKEEHRLPCDFFGHCCVAFNTPSEITEQDVLERAWRLERIAQNEKRASAYVTSKQAKFRSKIGVASTPHVPSSLSWHPVLDALVVGSTGQSEQVAWCRGVSVSAIDHTLDISGGVTSMQWINPETSELLLVGSSETAVHLFRNPSSGCAGDEHCRTQQVAAWRPFVPAVGLRSPVITSWSPQLNALFTSGNVGFVRAWDMERQYALMDLATNINAGVTVMSSTGGGGDGGGYNLITGFASGAIKVFDPRQPPSTSNTKDLLGFTSCVMGLHVPVTSPNSVVAVSRDGSVKIWDIRAGSTRQSNALRAFSTKGKSDVSAFAVHNYAPVLVCGYLEQQIHIYNLNGDQLRVIRYHEGFLEERIGPIAALAFHPTKMLFAAASTDRFVSVFQNE